MKATRKQIIDEALKQANRPDPLNLLTIEEAAYICSHGWVPDGRETQVIRTIAGTPDHDRVTAILAKVPDQKLIRCIRVIEPED